MTKDRGRQYQKITISYKILLGMETGQTVQIRSYKGGQYMLKNKRGIVLITTMLTVVLVIMLLSSVVYSNLGSMRLASNFYGREEALMAAQSGVEYAVTCLQSDVTWRGDKQDNTFTNSAEGISVRERNGNVVGMLTTANGNKSFFRIKFNYEDGENGFDGMKDSSDSERIQSPYVSVNNLFNTTPTKVYTASQDGKLKTKQSQDRFGKNRTEADGASSFSLGKSSCYLVVEGFAGNGVRDLTLDKAFTLTPEQVSNLNPRRVETYLALSSETQFTDSVACAADDLTTDSNLIRISNAKGSSSPKMRSLHNLNVTSGTVDFDNSQLYYGSGYSYSINGKTISEDSKYTAQQSNDTSSFTRLEWDDVTKANSKGQKCVAIQAGTYVWSKDPKTNENVLRRYVGNYPPGTKIPSDAKSSIVTSLKGMTIDAKTLTMKIDSNLWVASDGKASSLIIRYDKEGETATSRPVVAFLKNEAKQTSPIISSDHDIYIEGATLGGGSITSKKNISLQGPSILESDPGIGVSIYAQGDVNLLPIESVTEQVKQAESEKFTGTPSTGTDNNKTAEFKVYNDYKVQYDRALAAYQALMAQYSGWYHKDPKNFKNPGNLDQIFKQFFNHYFQANATYYATGEAPQQKWYDADFKNVTDAELMKCFQALDSLTNDGASFSNEPGIPKNVREARERFYRDGKKAFDYLEEDNNWTPPHEEPESSDTEKTEIDLSPDKVSDVQDYVDKDLASDNFRDTKEAQLSDLMLRYGKIKYSDQDISGVIYAWGNINADIGKNSTLNLTGAMVAYGGNPKEKTPGKNNKGKIDINAGTIGMTLDPDYMGVFLAANAKRKVKQVMFSNF